MAAMRSTPRTLEPSLTVSACSTTTVHQHRCTSNPGPPLDEVCFSSSFIMKHDTDVAKSKTNRSRATTGCDTATESMLAKGGGGSETLAGAFAYTQARALYNSRRYVECVALCRRGEQAGNAQAQSILGQCFFNGRGVPPNGREAVRLARLAAAQNEPLGLRLLGWCHYHGKGGLVKDSTRAAELCHAAAAHGCADGMSDLGYMKWSGKGTPKDRGRAQQLFYQACQQGHGLGTRNLGTVTKDLQGKMKWHFKAATAPASQIAESRRQQSASDCCTAAHKLTDPQCNDHDNDHDFHATFIDSIQACVDDAVLAARAESNHATRIVASLNQLRLCGKSSPSTGCANTGHCDVILEAGGQCFPCHRLVLMAASAFFQTLFSSSFVDSNAASIPLSECQPEMAERLVAYIYTGKIAFANVEDGVAVLEKAQFFQIDTLVTACTRYLLPRVGACNSRLIGAAAQGRLCARLVQACVATKPDFVIEVSSGAQTSVEGSAKRLGKRGLL